MGKNKIDPFVWLTEKRKNIFRLATRALNQHQIATINNSQHIYDRMSNRGKSFNTRDWGLSYYREYFSDDEGVKDWSVYGMEALVFDNLYFLRTRLIDRFDNLPPEPDTIMRARYESNLPQPPLPPIQKSFLPDDLLEEEPLLLQNMYFLVAGYRRNENGLIVSLDIIDQVDVDYKDHRSIDLNLGNYGSLSSDFVPKSPNNPPPSLDAPTPNIADKSFDVSSASIPQTEFKRKSPEDSDKKDKKA